MRQLCWSIGPIQTACPRTTFLFKVLWRPSFGWYRSCPGANRRGEYPNWSQTRNISFMMKSAVFVVQFNHSDGLPSDALLDPSTYINLIQFRILVMGLVLGANIQIGPKAKYSKGSNNRSDAINIFKILHRTTGLIKCGAINYNQNTHRGAYMKLTKVGFTKIPTQGGGSLAHTIALSCGCFSWKIWLNGLLKLSRTPNLTTRAQHRPNKQP